MKGRNRQNKRDKKRERELISGFPPSTFYLTKARAVPSHSQELGTASGNCIWVSHEQRRNPGPCGMHCYISNSWNTNPDMPT